MTNWTELRLETLEQGVRFRARAGSGTELVTDSGRGMVAPSPVEMLLASLGACGGMDVIGILRKKRQQVTGYEIRVSGERPETFPRAFTRIEVVHRLHGRDLSPAAIEEAIRLSDTKYCSVHASLSEKIELVSRFEIVAEESR